MKTRLDNKSALKKLVGRKIVAANLYEGEDDINVNPTLTLDNGDVISFDVDDYGSGTYGINLEIEKKG